VAVNWSDALPGFLNNRSSLAMVKPFVRTRVLPYSLPYDWEAVLIFFRVHQLPYVECVDDSSYGRVVRNEYGFGWIPVLPKSPIGRLQHAVVSSNCPGGL
jgi:hypothetical protein